MTVARGQPWRSGPDGLVVRVRLTPKASRDAIEGIEPTADGPALKARVRAVPKDGAANRAVTELVANWLGLPKSAVALIAGGKSRVKSLRIAGDGVALAGRVEALLAETEVKEASHG